MGTKPHACASNLLDSLDPNSDALDENGFSKNQLDNLYWYFSQCESTEDPVGGIIEMYKASYSVTKTRVSVSFVNPHFELYIPRWSPLPLNIEEIHIWQRMGPSYKTSKAYFQHPVGEGSHQVYEKCIQLFWLILGHSRPPFARDHHSRSIYGTHVHEVHPIL